MQNILPNLHIKVDGTPLPDTPMSHDDSQGGEMQRLFSNDAVSVQSGEVNLKSAASTPHQAVEGQSPSHINMSNKKGNKVVRVQSPSNKKGKASPHKPTAAPHLLNETSAALNDVNDINKIDSVHPEDSSSLQRRVDRDREPIRDSFASDIGGDASADSHDIAGAASSVASREIALLSEEQSQTHNGNLSSDVNDVVDEGDPELADTSKDTLQHGHDLSSDRSDLSPDTSQSLPPLVATHLMEPTSPIPRGSPFSSSPNEKRKGKDHRHRPPVSSPSAAAAARRAQLNRSGLLKTGSDDDLDLESLCPPTLSSHSSLKSSGLQGTTSSSIGVAAITFHKGGGRGKVRVVIVIMSRNCHCTSTENDNR